MEMKMLIFTGVLAVATIFMAIATIVMAMATKRLESETRKSREDSQRPKLSAKLKPNKDVWEFVELVIANVGKGPAFNVRFRLVGDEADLDAHSVVTRGNSAPISFIGPSESETYMLNSTRALSQDPPIKPFRVHIDYADLNGNQIQEDVVLDAHQFEGLWGQRFSPAWRQMEAIEKILRTLDLYFRHRFPSMPNV